MIILFSLASSCLNKEAEEKKEEENQQPAPNTVSLTEIQMKTGGIELGTIELKNLKSSVKANGILTVPNQNKAFVTSVTTGVIRTLNMQPGNLVHKGQVVATIMNPDVAKLQQELQTVNAQINLSEIELKRQNELVEGNAAPLKNVQRVETELSTLRTQRNSLQKQLSAIGISTENVNKGNIVTTIGIAAPISGTVSNISAQIGSEVNPATPIAEIVNNSQLHLDLFVFEKDLPRLHINQTIHFTLTNNPGKEYDAQIYSIGTAFASETKTIPIHAVVKGDKTGLIEGMSVTALISLGESVAPAVPNDAIVSFQGQDYILALVDEETTKPGERRIDTEENKNEKTMTFERLRVIKGATDVGYTEVTLLKNIPPTKQIVTKGAFFVLAKMTNIEHED
jgi:RND family efflux transporter, MFP subunit